MKYLFKKVSIIFCAICIIMLLPKITYAKTINKGTVDKLKNWEVHFNQEFNIDDIKNYITVTDTNGNNQNIDIESGSDSKTVLVKAPSNGYIPGNYILKVSSNAKSKSSKNLKEDVIVNFSVDSNIKSIPDYTKDAWQGNNYALPKSVKGTLKDGSTAELSVIWDKEFIDGSKVGTYTYYGKVDGYNGEVKLIINVKPINNVYDFSEYLNQYFGSLQTPLGLLHFTFTIDENELNFFPQDMQIKTDWNPSEFSPYELQYSIKINDTDKQKTIDLLKDFQQKIANEAFKYFPNKKIEGGFFTSGYEYQYIHAGYWTTKFLTWINYNYDVLNASDYKSTQITNFQWFNLYDDYNFTGEAKRTR